MQRILFQLALVMLFCAAAQGSIVNELEIGGVVNNTPATAQPIAPADFTTPVPSTVFDPPGWVTATVQATGGNADVDFFSFSTAGGGAMFDMDNDPFVFGTILSLFNSAETLIAYSGGSAPDSGSASTNDPFIGVITLSPGSYFVAVSRANNPPNGHSTGTIYTTLVRPDGAEGDNIAVTGARVGDSTFPSNGADGLSPYTFHISLENAAVTAVPEASGFLAWTVLGAVTLVALKLRSWIASEFVRLRV